MFTNEKMAENTAHRLAMFLKGKGIEITHYDSTLRPIEKVLRGSWYVKKAKEMGHTDCIHIGLICGGFFAILENWQKHYDLRRHFFRSHGTKRNRPH